MSGTKLNSEKHDSCFSCRRTNRDSPLHRSAPGTATHANFIEHRFEDLNSSSIILCTKCRGKYNKSAPSHTSSQNSSIASNSSNITTLLQSAAAEISSLEKKEIPKILGDFETLVQSLTRKGFLCLKCRQPAQHLRQGKIFQSHILFIKLILSHSYCLCNLNIRDLSQVQKGVQKLVFVLISEPSKNECRNENAWI